MAKSAGETLEGRASTAQLMLMPLTTIELSVGPVSVYAKDAQALEDIAVIQRMLRDAMHGSECELHTPLMKSNPAVALLVGDLVWVLSHPDETSPYGIFADDCTLVEALRTVCAEPDLYTEHPGVSAAVFEGVTMGDAEKLNEAVGSFFGGCQ